MTNLGFKKMPKHSPLLAAFTWLCFLTGFVLLAINVYGLFQPLRMPGLGIDGQEHLRFIPERTWEYQHSLKQIEQLKSVASESALVNQANHVVNKSLVHIEWEKVDPVAYRLRVPIWENYFLYFMGEFSGLPQFQRYHYADFERNIERGVGICGDASTILSSVLDQYKVENSIVSFQGHVIVETENKQGDRRLLDPDFGVLINHDLETLLTDPEIVRPVYLEAGYSDREVNRLVKAYGSSFRVFDDTYHFMTKRYIFENVTYFLKWIFPVLLILFSLFIGRKLYFSQD